MALKAHEFEHGGNAIELHQQIKVTPGFAFPSGIRTKDGQAFNSMGFLELGKLLAQGQ